MANPSSSNPKAGAATLVEITVELFGTARIACNRRDVALKLPSSATLAEIVYVLGEACPQLIGKAIVEDLSGLVESFTLNLNGTTFVSGSAAQRLELSEGDTLLLFSSQAGG